MDEEVVIHRFIDTHTHIHTHNGVLPGHKKEWNLAICDNMDGPRGAKWNNTDRERQYCMISLTYGI